MRIRAIGGKRILLLDEPTSALDRVNKTYVLQMIQYIARQKTCLIVSHDRECIQIADRVVRLKDGVVVEEGGAAH